jgi:hypothetical protein
MLHTCNQCKEDNLLSDEMCLSHGFAKVCKKCYNTYKRNYNKRPNRITKVAEIARKSTLKRNYGMTLEEYDKRVELQLGGCAICKQPCELVVDHNHKTNRVRNLLCIKCNVILGLVNDDEELLFALIEYLKRHSEKIA